MAATTSTPIRSRYTAPASRKTAISADASGKTRCPKQSGYSRNEIRDTLGLDPDAITDADGVGLAEGEGLWFYTSSTNQMVNRAPEEQDVMVRGCRDAILTMMESEPNGKGYQNPGFYK